MNQNIFTESVCRVCLDSNVAMCCIADNTELQEIYETLANTKLNTGDGRPEALCYICYYQLQKNCSFSKLAKKSDEILMNLVNNGLKVTNETVSMLNYGNGMQKKFSIFVLSPTVLPSSQLSVIQSCQDVCVKDEFEDFESAENSHVEDDETGNVEEIEYYLNNEEVKTDNHHDKTECLKEINVIETKLDKANGADVEKFKEIVMAIDKKDIISDHKETYTKEVVTINNNKKRKKNTYICNECNATYTNKKLFASHLQIHKPKTKSVDLYCEKCLKKFNRRRAFSQHMKQHTDGRTYHCHLCDKAFYMNTNLVRHLKIHTGEKPYSCDVCGKNFIQKIHLSHHMTIHTGEKPYSCNICNKSFRLKTLLQIHLKNHTEEKKQGTSFQINNRTFKSQAKNLVCETCNKTYSRNIHLDRHLKLHTGERPYPCNLCDKAYIQKSALTSHMKTHYNVKNKILEQVCHICGKIYKKRRLLNMHLKTHTRNHFCNICNKGFPTRTTLKIHMPVHSKVKAHTCYVCDKKFSTPATLNFHLKAHID